MFEGWSEILIILLLGAQVNESLLAKSQERIGGDFVEKSIDCTMYMRKKQNIVYCVSQYNSNTPFSSIYWYLIS